jgi:predicted RNase H-like nuclease
VTIHRGPTLPYHVIASVTPCPPGWLVQAAKIQGATFAPERPQVYGTFLEILDERPTYELLLVNAPVGYRDHPSDPPRHCDAEARHLLGSRGAAIHNAPTRPVLLGTIGWRDGGLDAVTATLLPRFREVAAEMSPFRQRVVYEGNPELSFFQLNRDTSMRRSKRLAEGRDERFDLLDDHVPGGIDTALDDLPHGVATRHQLDALALLWSARRVWGHGARRIPREPEWDSDGLRMEFVF